MQDQTYSDESAAEGHKEERAGRELDADDIYEEIHEGEDEQLALQEGRHYVHRAIVHLGHAEAFVDQLARHVEHEEVDEDLVARRDEGDAEDLNEFPNVSEYPAAVVPRGPGDALVGELHSDENVGKNEDNQEQRNRDDRAIQRHRADR